MMRYLIFLFLLTCTAFGASKNILFILDGSGSMWGRVDGDVKIEVARDVMTDLIGDLPDDASVGLMAYGHRRKGDCTDIELLEPLAPLNRERLTAAVSGLVPKGKTPISASVRLAVEQVRQLESTTTIILVSDGRESCDGDPCEAVRAAKRAGVDFRLHVVGFDLGEDGIDELKCMAKAGGGEYISAANAEELAGALKQAVDSRPGLVLKVTNNGEALDARTYVLEAGKDSVLARESTDEDGLAKYALDPGSYDVRIRPGGINPRDHYIEDVTVTAGETTEKSIDFSSGSVELTVTANGEPLKASTYLLNAKNDKEAARDGTDDLGVARYSVPVGEYRIRIRPRGINARDQFIEDVTVTAGETTGKSIDIPSGKVVLTVTNRGEPLDARTYIQTAENGKETARDSTDAEGVARYSIPVGEYRIRIRPDGIDAPDYHLGNIKVEAGETTRTSFDFAERESDD